MCDANEFIPPNEQEVNDLQSKVLDILDITQHYCPLIQYELMLVKHISFRDHLLLSFFKTTGTNPSCLFDLNKHWLMYNTLIT